MRHARLLFVALALTAACDCNESTDESASTTPTPAEPAPEPLAALEAPEVNMDKVYLGRRLFHDPILSGDGTISCATCHSLDHAGAEPRRSSNGIRGQVGPINSPTVLNAHFNFVQFWDGRAANLQEQAGGPVENPLEMGTTFPEAIERVKTDAWYVERFASIYGGEDPINKENITDALAEYERYLVTPSPFDAYLAGNQEAISEQARRGHATFKEVGCASCHMGVNVGGTMYQKMGVVQNYFEARGGELTEADMGRFNVTQAESDRHFFKVPTLRNVALTAPYFHDGSIEALDEAVRVMGRVQLGRDLEDNQVADIVAFLQSLNGELPEHARLPEDETPPSRAAAPAEGEAPAEGATEG
ncbi:MAG: cytochrome-c peroxidase [Sandaracinus sp.]|nr:cytochrome-c peroxidase [Sandaracinus sp.]MCB9621510.1 cytochrome-c peroxidase [Sandaracinus sp.]